MSNHIAGVAEHRHARMMTDFRSWEKSDLLFKRSGDAIHSLMASFHSRHRQKGSRGPRDIVGAELPVGRQRMLLAGGNFVQHHLERKKIRKIRKIRKKRKKRKKRK